MSFEWRHQGYWEHRLYLNSGERLVPTRLVVDSATRDAGGKVVPAAFCELPYDGRTTLLRWVPWTEIRTIESVSVIPPVDHPD